MIPRTHTNDPDTSHDAEDRHRDSGRLGANARTVLGYVKRWPGNGAKGLHSRVRMNFHKVPLLPLQEIRRRLTDLDHKGLVERRQVRKDGKLVFRNGSRPVFERWDGECLYWPTARGMLAK